MSNEPQNLAETLAEIAKDPQSHGEPADPDELPPGIGIAPEFYCILGGCDNLPKLRIRPKIGDEYEIRAYACDDHFPLLHGGSVDQWVTSEERDEVFPEPEPEPNRNASPKDIMNALQRLLEKRIPDTTPLDEVQDKLDALADEVNLGLSVSGVPMPFRFKFIHEGNHHIVVDTVPLDKTND